MAQEDLAQACIEVLKANDRKDHTIPAGGLYPHQWLWDSCFIAIGQRHYDVNRARIEILNVLRGQWSNGMLPHMILSPSPSHRQSVSFWRSSVSPYSPDYVATSGLTQPPVLAEAIVRIGEKLPKEECRVWYQSVYPALLAYHEWLYRERDPKKRGLVLQVHPWETGLDNTPPWMDVIHTNAMPTWIKIVRSLRLDSVIGSFRSDLKHAPPGERLSTIDALSLYSIQRRLRRNQYDIKKIIKRSDLLIEDVNFNAILIRANQHLKTIAKFIGKELPKDLVDNIIKSEAALEELWDPYSGQYYSRAYRNKKLIKVASVGTLLPLYAGCISKDRAKQLVTMLSNKDVFATPYPVASVPVNSPWFQPHLYWQGPTWVNINWLLIDGLKRYGFDKQAKATTKQTIELVQKSGSSEYFSPLDGSPAGAKNFSWTAALTLDLLQD